jgi:FkbM family methyltransferase
MMRKLLTPIVNLLKPTYVVINAHRLYIDKWDATLSQELLLSGKWEDYEVAIFKGRIHPGDTVVDIGAHIGYYTLIAAKQVGNKGLVYAFEPDPRNFALLKENINANGYRNVVLVNKAVSDTSGNGQLYLNSENTGDHRIFNADPDRQAIKIAITTLDEFFKDKEKRINIIKMDIQGSELRTLRGARKLITQNKSIIVMSEFWPRAITLSGDRPRDYLRLLRHLGFRLQSIDEANHRLHTVTSDTDLLASYPAGESTVDLFTNLLCEKKPEP